LHRRRVRNVDLDEQAAPPRRLDRRSRRLDVVRIGRVPAGDDVRARFGEDAGGGGADAGGRAGDERDAAVEPERRAHRDSSTTPTTSAPRPATSFVFAMLGTAWPTSVI